MLDRTLCILLAGGVGSRLHPLTKERAKPAVPFGANYRIIDFTLSNCLHSGLRRVLVLTQYKSHSLQKHLRDGWSIFNPALGEYITCVPPQMRTGDSWYAGTADAIYQNSYLVDRSDADYVVILSGDHIYRMDYAAMLAAHRDNDADLTVACMDVPLQEATAFGVLSVDQSSRIIAFDEKPAVPQSIPGRPDRALVSMGIYVFNRSLLSSALRDDHSKPGSRNDFGRDIIPEMLATRNVFAYRFGGNTGRVSPDCYWRDVGTIDSYFEANMDLLRPIPPLDLYQSDWRILTRLSASPPARLVPGPQGQPSDVQNAIVGSGAIVVGASVYRSLLSPDVRVGHGARVNDSVVLSGVTIGEGAELNRCIIDKHVHVPPGITIGTDCDSNHHGLDVSEGGVTVVAREHVFA